MSEWIKCSERMPLEGEKVLTAFRGCVRTAWCKRVDVVSLMFVDEYQSHGVPAEHWMYPPKPPEE